MQGFVDVLLRAIILYILIFAVVRVRGKKHPARMTPFTFINYVVIATITAFIVLRAVNLIPGLVVLAVWALAPIALDFLAIRSKSVHDVLHGKETVLIKQGKIMEENLQHVKLTGEDLLQGLRLKNVFNVADVEFAVLESTGDVSVLLKTDKKPVTPHDMEWKVTPQTEPQTVILDGNIVDEPLTEMGLNRNWLHTQLETTGIILDNVFVGQVDSNGELYLDLFDDAVQLPQAKVRELLYANLEKAHADLTTFALQTKQPEVKSIYIHNAARLKKLIDNLQPYLLR